MVLSTIQLIIARATVFSKNKMDGYDWTVGKFNGRGSPLKLRGIPTNLRGNATLWCKSIALDVSSC